MIASSIVVFSRTNLRLARCGLVFSRTNLRLARCGLVFSRDNLRLARCGRSLAGVIAALALAGSAGCATVVPYERGKLAHPTMTAGDLAGFGESHLRAIHEGAIGGNGGTGSGCGCN